MPPVKRTLGDLRGTIPVPGPQDFEAVRRQVRATCGEREPAMADMEPLLRSHLETVPEVTLAYLFGSQVTGPTGPLSDTDIAVWVTSPSPELRARLSHALASLLHIDRIDLVFLNRAPVELAYAIIAQGRLVYQRSVAERVEFEAGVLARYGDYLPILKRQQRETLEGTPHEAGVRRYRAALRRTERTLAAIRAAKR